MLENRLVIKSCMLLVICHQKQVYSQQQKSTKALLPYPKTKYRYILDNTGHNLNLTSKSSRQSSCWSGRMCTARENVLTACSTSPRPSCALPSVCRPTHQLGHRDTADSADFRAGNTSPTLKNKSLLCTLLKNQSMTPHYMPVSPNHEANTTIHYLHVRLGHHLVYGVVIWGEGEGCIPPADGCPPPLPLGQRHPLLAQPLGLHHLILQLQHLKYGKGCNIMVTRGLPVQLK